MRTAQEALIRSTDAGHGGVKIEMLFVIYNFKNVIIEKQ
jgi:hypothetical protein